jgi:hypothetical protein
MHHLERKNGRSLHLMWEIAAANETQDVNWLGEANSTKTTAADDSYWLNLLERKKKKKKK